MIPLISIIVPVYNARVYIGQCIESIITQTLKEIEIILINDGSTDGSGKICDSYKKKDERIKVIHQENKGVSCARNRGIQEAIGQTIMFVDSDDSILPNMCEKMWYSFKKYDADLCICGMQHVYYENSKIVKSTNDKVENGYFNGIKQFEEILVSLYRNYLIFSPCVKLYKSNIIKKYNLLFLEGINLGEDLLFNLAYLNKCIKFVTINKCLYQYRHFNKEALTQTFSRNRIQWGERIFCEANDFCVKNDLPTNMYQEIANKYYRYYLCAAELLSSANCDLSGREKKKYMQAIIRQVNQKRNLKAFHHCRLETKLYQLLFSFNSIFLLTLFSMMSKKIKIWLK